MTEHNIEELERQLKQAQSAETQATLRVSEARLRLSKAKFAATGLAGCVAEFEHRKGQTIRFLPKRLDRFNYYVEGPAFKKDGTLGAREVGCAPAKVRNLGPYEPAPSPKPDAA